VGALTGTARRTGVAATLFLLLGMLGCSRGDRTTVEAVRLIAPPPGVLAPTYTLADETRPVLALPPERRLDLPVPAARTETTYTFTLPEDVAGDVIATGSLQRAQHFHPVPAQLLSRSRDPDGSPRATLTLPAVALGDGPASTLTLMLTTPPASPVIATSIDQVAVPEGARLELAFGMSPAAGIPGAAPVTLEIAAEVEGGAEQTLWSATVQGESADGPRWTEIAVPLAPVAGRTTRFTFRARALGDGRPVVLPLWADPTIVAPAPRPAARRNVILISIDTLRADRLAAYGAYRRTMPQIDAFARDAVIFTDTWSVWPETSGSHMSIFSSRFPSEHQVTSFITAPSPAIELLAERLRREGYLTRAYTEDGGVWAYAGFARGFSAYAERRSADFVYRGEVDAVFADGTRWVETHADRNFFLFLHTYQVHGPYSPPADYRGLFLDVPGREPPGPRDAALAYDQEARYTDDHIGPFLAHLARLGLADRTIVIILSDHGEEFGDHGGMGHGRTLHQEVLRVPLVIAAPGLLAPANVTSPTSLLDVAPTVLDLLGLAPIPGHRGVSLVARARAAARDAVDPAEVARPIFGEVDRTERTRIQQVSVRRNHAAAIADLTTNTVRCYAADDRAELEPTGSCPELRELIELHRQASVPVGSGASERQADPDLIEKMRALGYLQ
jgi:arylsulfatase A-like enzyme